MGMGTNMPASTICKVTKEGYGDYHAGEFNTQNTLEHGRGIRVCKNGDIHIQRWRNGWKAPGNFITTYSDGLIHVGKFYLTPNGKRKWRGT